MDGVTLAEELELGVTLAVDPLESLLDPDVALDVSPDPVEELEVSLDPDEAVDVSSEPVDAFELVLALVGADAVASV